jgi:hypothetical protein
VGSGYEQHPGRTAHGVSLTSYGNTSRSPDLRKESGLCVFGSTNPSPMGRSGVQACGRSSTIRMRLYCRARVADVLTHPVLRHDRHRHAAGLSIPPGIENSGT